MACSCYTTWGASSPARRQEVRDSGEFLRLHLVSAQLVRSFCKVGVMDPYVVVKVDGGTEVMRTWPAKWAHKNPKWDETVTVRGDTGGLPNSITLSVFNANKFSKDVLCGSVTLPCSADMGFVDEKDFALAKSSLPTGTIRVSLEPVGMAKSPKMMRMSSNGSNMTTLGAELDHMSTWIESPKGTRGKLMFHHGDEKHKQGHFKRRISKDLRHLRGEVEAATVRAPVERRTVSSTSCCAPILRVLGLQQGPQRQPIAANVAPTLLATRSRSQNLEEAKLRQPIKKPATLILPSALRDPSQDDKMSKVILPPVAVAPAAAPAPVALPSAAPSAAPVPLTSPPAAAAGNPVEEIRATLCCSWTCTETHGMEEFLKASGINAFQRKLALAAKWPAWDFELKGDKLLFINHSALGDLKEEILMDGKTYEWKDGRSNLLKCTAVWEATPGGGVLRISRSGEVGKYSEIRQVDGDKLSFELTNEAGISWGRVFQRTKK